MVHKLRRKFIRIAMVSVTLVMLLMAVSINTINFLSTDSDLEHTLVMIRENAGNMPQFSPVEKPGPKREERFSPEKPYSTRYFVLYYTPSGTLTQADMKHIAAVTEEDAGTYLEIARKHGEGFGYTGNYKFYVVDTGGQCMAIFLDCYGELHSLRVFALISLLVAAGCVALVFVLVLSRRAITPVIESAEKQKQFITDASHELKTPLTVINTSLKVLEMETGKSKWTDKIQSQTDKLTRLVNDLVTLSRLDEEKPPLQFRDFSVSAAVEETAESFRDFAGEQGHCLDLRITPDLSCRGDEYAVRQLVSILLDNAIKYADPGSVITLSLTRRKKGVLLETLNPCAGLDERETGKLFDRFYRADKARSGQSGGFGVGLSIAQSIVQAHHGAITAECPQPGMIRFSALLR